MAVLFSLVAGPARVAGATTGPLRPANDAARQTYTFRSLRSCEVGDALSVVEVAGASPVRLTALSLLYDGAAASAQRATFRVVAFRRGTFAGQLGTTFDLTSLKLGTPLGAAGGAVLEPLATSGRWYVLVADVRVVGPHRGPWRIEGLGVSYSVGASGYSQLFRQSVALPATSRCH